MQDENKAAQDICRAIRIFAERPENIDRLENYLDIHMDIWMQKYASTPEDLASELLYFATME